MSQRRRSAAGWASPHCSVQGLKSARTRKPSGSRLRLTPGGRLPRVLVDRCRNSGQAGAAGTSPPRSRRTCSRCRPCTTCCAGSGWASSRPVSWHPPRPPPTTCRLSAGHAGNRAGHLRRPTLSKASPDHRPAPATTRILGSAARLPNPTPIAHTTDGGPGCAAGTHRRRRRNRRQRQPRPSTRGRSSGSCRQLTDVADLGSGPPLTDFPPGESAPRRVRRRPGRPGRCQRWARPHRRR
jgi:hypothetical protein